MQKAIIDRRSLPQGRRILVISDIHGNLPYFKGLLEHVHFSPEDVLILCGDMLEKGPYSLATLQYIMALAETHTVWPLLGNCDGWHRLLFDRGAGMTVSAREYIRSGVTGWGRSIVSQMCAAMDFPLTEGYDMDALCRALTANFSKEMNFLDALPHVIDTPHYIFVHGGLPEGEPDTWDAFRCMKNDSFMTQGRRFDKWVIVGHWPVMLYREDITCANPIIDRESHIVSLDGGCVLKDDGQLNALIIPHDGSEDFSFAAWDPFPARRALDAQTPSKTSYYIRWGDNLVRVLQRGEEFSRVRHERTGYEMDVLTKNLYGEGERVRCNDCTDYVLPVSPGDVLHIVEETSRGYLAKKDGVSGWYFGALE